MKTRYRLIRRGLRGGGFYCVDTQTGKRTSLNTSDKDAAKQIILAKNQSERQPMLNLRIAKAYLAGTDSGMTTRTWQQVMDEIVKMKKGENRHRWKTAMGDKAFDPIRERVAMDTRPEHFLQVLEKGRVSSNVYLRRIHNFALDMGWLPQPLIPRRQWPVIHFKEKRAITKEEHLKILEHESNPERWAFYQLAWYLGGSQGDIANLNAEDIDWANHTIAYARQKTQSIAIIHFGSALAAVLKNMPGQGPLFPWLRTLRPSDRATAFQRRASRLGITGVSLHSYRYAWAERAKTCGYPERFAQQALGHNSKAVHRMYARKAQVQLPPLEDYERDYAKKMASLANPPLRKARPAEQSKTDVSSVPDKIRPPSRHNITLN